MAEFKEIKEKVINNSVLTIVSPKERGESYFSVGNKFIMTTQKGLKTIPESVIDGIVNTTVGNPEIYTIEVKEYKNEKDLADIIGYKSVEKLRVDVGKLFLKR